MKLSPNGYLLEGTVAGGEVVRSVRQVWGVSGAFCGRNRVLRRFGGG